MSTTPPSLFIVIGANGAGKTTWTRTNRHLLPQAFYNADSIAEGLGDPSAAEPQRQARELVDQKITERLNAHESFGFESTWSGDSRPAIVAAAKKAGYSTGALFIGTSNPEINIVRVRQRVLEGGHDVPESEIRRRWHAASANLAKHWSQLDHIEILDNTANEPRLVHVSTVDRSVSSQHAPAWVNDILSSRPAQTTARDTMVTPNELTTSLSQSDRGIEL